MDKQIQKKMKKKRKVNWVSMWSCRDCRLWDLDIGIGFLGVSTRALYGASEQILVAMQASTLLRLAMLVGPRPSKGSKN